MGSQALSSNFKINIQGNDALSMKMKYDIQEAQRGYEWLGHDKDYTELNAFHPLYKKGREHLEFNQLCHKSCVNGHNL